MQRGRLRPDVARCLRACKEVARHSCASSIVLGGAACNGARERPCTSLGVMGVCSQT